MTDPIVKVSNLTYSYGNKATILSDINLHVPTGSIYGFLGPNGSGKTTTLSLLLGLLQNQTGSVEIFGRKFPADRIEILRQVGSLIENPSLYGHLNARENLEVYRSLYGAPLSRVEEVLRLVKLDDTGKKRVREFSLGMKQRLALALALLPWPKLLVLDEPTNGLDPVGILELREIIRTLNKEMGITVLISSHILSEVERLVTHVGIISKGRIVYEGLIGNLHLLRKEKSKLLINTSDNARASLVLENYPQELVDDCIAIPFTDNSEVSVMNKLLVDASIDVYRLQPTIKNLEQIFIDLTA